jgi:hypothetical protein
VCRTQVSDAATVGGVVVCQVPRFIRTDGPRPTQAVPLSAATTATGDDRCPSLTCALMYRAISALGGGSHQVFRGLRRWVVRRCADERCRAWVRLVRAAAICLAVRGLCASAIRATARDFSDAARCAGLRGFSRATDRAFARFRNVAACCAGVLGRPRWEARALARFALAAAICRAVRGRPRAAARAFAKFARDAARWAAVRGLPR